MNRTCKFLIYYAFCLYIIFNECINLQTLHSNDLSFEKIDPDVDDGDEKSYQKIFENFIKSNSEVQQNQSNKTKRDFINVSQQEESDNLNNFNEILKSMDYETDKSLRKNPSSNNQKNENENANYNLEIERFGNLMHTMPEDSKKLEINESNEKINNNNLVNFDSKVENINDSSEVIKKIQNDEKDSKEENSIKKSPTVDEIGKKIDNVMINSEEVKIPQIKNPEVSTFELKLLETKIPEIKTPEIKIPEVSTSELKLLETKIPEIKTPETKIPEVSTSELKAPEIKTSEIKLHKIQNNENDKKNENDKINSSEMKKNEITKDFQKKKTGFLNELFKKKSKLVENGVNEEKKNALENKKDQKKIVNETLNIADDSVKSKNKLTNGIQKSFQSTNERYKNEIDESSLCECQDSYYNQENLRSSEYENSLFEFGKVSSLNSYKFSGDSPSFLLEKTRNEERQNRHLSEIYFRDDYIFSFFKAIEEENLGAIERFFIYFQTEYITNDFDENALFFAIRKHKNNVIRYLIKRGFDYKIKNKNGFSALQVASKYKNFEALMILKEVIRDN